MNQPPQPQPVRPRHRVRTLLLVVVLILASAALTLGLLAAYSGVFQNRIRQAVVSEIEKDTGGRVQLQGFTWHLLHLEFAVTGLTIHGREAPDQVPWFHANRLYVRLRILSFFRAKIGLDYLQADHPVLHLIVYPDGSTNQPHPKHPSSRSTKTEIFDLRIGRTVVDNGLILLNQRKIPFNLTADNLSAQAAWVPADGHYVGHIHAENVVAQQANQPPVESTLDASLDVGRNSARLVSLTLLSNRHSRSRSAVIRLSGSIRDFAHPQWQFAAKGAVDAREIEALTGAPGLRAGILQVDASGHGVGARFDIDGLAGITAGAYREDTVYLTGVSATTRVHVTPQQISLTDIRARAASGGTAQGSFTLANWYAPAATAPERGAIRVRLADFSLDSILASVAPHRFRHLGFDTAATGTATVDWANTLSSLRGAVDVTLAPARLPAPPHEVPVTGTVQAQYLQRIGSVVVSRLHIHTPASEIQVTGTLGVYPFTRPTHLQATAATHDLAEFDPVLEAFGISAPGQPSPVPADLHGEAQFHGTVSGSIDSPDFSGHVDATDFQIAIDSKAPAAQAIRNIHFDRLIADAEYSPGALTIRAATLAEKQTLIRISGRVRGNPRKPSDLFAKSSTVQAQLRVNHADVAQWMTVTGRSYPISGTANLSAQVTGTIGDLRGSGSIAVTGGEIHGQPYRYLRAALQLQGKDVTASSLAFAVDGGKLTGSGGYNFAARTVQFNLQGSGFQLQHIQLIQKGKYPISGLLAFSARGSGPLEWPSLDATIRATHLSLATLTTGSATAEAHARNGILQTSLSANLNAGTVEMHGQTRLSGDFVSQLRLNISRLNIDPLLRTFSVTGIRGSSEIAAAVTLDGPLRHPKQLDGEASVSELALTLEGVPLHSVGNLHATLRKGMLRLDRVRIVGQDTDLHVEGSLGMFATPRPITLNAGGAVNVALAQTLDTDLAATGHVDFAVTAQGTTKAPDLAGQVKLDDVNLSLDDYTNGLSRMNGTLVFNQDRLDFQNVTAYSGGGLIHVGGFATYHHGLYFDLTANADQVRIRYPQGVTSTANATLRFEGTQQSMLFSGHVLLTGFSISPNLDFAALTSASSNVSLPPAPNSPASKVRLDIRITSAPSLNFQNSFARLAGAVNLSIRGTLAQPTVLGRVTVTEGTATFNGDKFELEHGEIYFSNPVRIEPIIDMTATTRVEDYTITIDLQGTASKLTPTFRSTPPLSEQDIFSLLAMGRTQEEQQIYQNEEAQAGVNSTAGALLGGALNATLSNRIQKLFGGGSVRIDPTFVSGVGDATARITVTEPISKQATLTYATNVNSTAEQLIQGEWHLTRNFSIVAVRDEAGVFSLVFRLHRRYR